MISPIFISHAVPWLLERQPRLAEALAEAGSAAKPAAVLVINSHWHTDHPAVGVFENAASWELDLARAASALLEEGGFRSKVEVVSAGAFDSGHSVWVPLSLMFGAQLPPVVALSVQPASGAAHHLRVGEALRPVTVDNLVIGSGSLTHNFAEVKPDYAPGMYVGWAGEFSQWMAGRVMSGDFEALVDYRRQAPNAVRSHPNEDHLLPLFVALGSSRYRKGTVLYDGITMGTVSLAAYTFK